MTEMQRKIEKNLLFEEKIERTKSFNVDFNKLKDVNETFRSITPQPIPLLSASCSVEKRNNYIVANNFKKTRRIPEESIFSKKSSIFPIIYIEKIDLFFCSEASK